MFYIACLYNVSPDVSVYSADQSDYCQSVAQLQYDLFHIGITGYHVVETHYAFCVRVTALGLYYVAVPQRVVGHYEAPFAQATFYHS